MVTLLALLTANFTSNETLTAFSEYISDNWLAIGGDPHFVGLILLTILMVLCAISGLSLDGAAFIILVAVMFFGYFNLLPLAVFLVALIASGAIVAWTFYKMVRK